MSSSVLSSLNQRGQRDVHGRQHRHYFAHRFLKVFIRNQRMRKINSVLKGLSLFEKEKKTTKKERERLVLYFLNIDKAFKMFVLYYFAAAPGPPSPRTSQPEAARPVAGCLFVSNGNFLFSPSNYSPQIPHCSFILRLMKGNPWLPLSQ